MEFNNQSIGYHMQRLEKELNLSTIVFVDRVYTISWRLDQLELYVPDHPDIRVLKAMLKLE
jgi:hypothetical protein